MSWSTTLKNRQRIRAQLESGEGIAVMFSDIRGFSSFTAREGDDAASRLSQRHVRLLRDRIVQGGGVLIKTLGDGIMAAFASSDEAVDTAIAVQRAIRLENRAAYGDEDIDVGIGISFGSPVMMDGDLIGHAVNLAQRISSEAKGGQILVSEPVCERYALADGLKTISVGKRSLRGIGMEALYEIVWLGEIVRVTDGHDLLTLILTERDTVVLEPAKTLHEAASPRHARGIRKALLRRPKHVAAGRIRDAIALEREHPINQLGVSLRGEDLAVQLAGTEFVLHGVEPESAARFIAAFNRARDAGIGAT
ncbi:adenylate/guanylate cyclase domain-containing protein [Candidatus Bipolaricaulota bacterium]|nr:adenylate/guanylate cyclase domain-containing protein [Candidatus Bipolaricaulota bacterium]